MRLVDYLVLVRRRFALFGVVMALVALMSLGLSMLQTPLFEAEVKLRTLPIAPGSLGASYTKVLEDQAVGSDIATEAQLVQSTGVATLVAEKLGIAANPADLIGTITVRGVGASQVLRIIAKAQDPVFSQNLANAFADAYLESRRDDARKGLEEAGAMLSSRLGEIERRLGQADARLEAAPAGSIAAADASAQRDLALADLMLVRSQLRDLSDGAALQNGFGEVIVPASSARLVRDTSPARSLVFGVLLGAPLALAIVLLMESLSETVRHRGDAEDVTGAEVLGLIPMDSALARNAGYAESSANNGSGRRGGALAFLRRRNSAATSTPTLAVDTDPFSVTSEAYRTASHNLLTAAERAGATTILFTSPMAGDGKTTTSVNLASVRADAGLETTLVDADLRRPVAHEVAGAELSPGVAELIGGASTPRRASQDLRPHFRFISAGEAVERPDQLLSDANVRTLLKKAQTKSVTSRNGNGNGNGNGNASKAASFLFDSAPLLQAAETLTLARHVDGVVLVLRAGVTRRQTATRAVEQIRRAGGTLLGVVLVGVDESAALGLSRGAAGSYRRRLALVNVGANGFGGHANGSNGHANGSNGHANGSNGHANGSNGATAKKRAGSDID